MDYLVNYGFINLPNNITVNEFDANCIIENRNEFNIAGNVKIASSTFYNDGRVSIAGTTENLGNIYNDHIFQVSGHFTNGSNADVTNNCQFIVTGHLHQHGKIENNDFIRTDQVLHFYENSTNVMGPQSLIAAGNVEIKSLIEGPTVNCAKIDVAVSTIITTSGSLTNNMDLCDENGIEENNGTIDPSVTFCNCYIPTTECNPGSGTPGDGGDSDNDGCPDDVDEYPNDPERCSNEYYPEEGKFSTLAFEDLWNSTGDYDFNDLVVETNYKIVKNGQNKVVEIFAKYHITAIGADLNNGFGIEFNTPGISIDTVIGSHLYGNAVTLKQNGIEEGPLNRTVVMVFDAINDYAGTAMVNTIPGGNSKTFDTIDIYIKFNHSVADIDPAPFNPFMFINQERGKETHMIDHAPTELVDVSYFGQNSDDSDPAQGRYYVTETNLPWVIEIPTTFDYPVETADILYAYLKFRDWAESSGQLYPDWYKDLPGYREPANIYKTANP
jgi:LruC domain-containing protein